MAGSIALEKETEATGLLLQKDRFARCGFCSTEGSSCPFPIFQQEKLQYREVTCQGQD